MTKDESLGTAAGVFILFLGGILVGTAVNYHFMKQAAVEHGCARYDPQTGDWGWTDRLEAKK